MKAVILKGIVVEDSLLCEIDVIEAPSAHLHHGVERPNEMYLITPSDEIKHNLDIRNQAGVLPKTDGTELIFMDKQLISSVYKELDIKTLISLIDYVNQNGKLSKRKLNKSERKEMEKFTGGCDHFREASEDLLKEMKDNFLWVEAKMFPVNKPYRDVKQLKQAHVIIAATRFVEKEVGGVVGVEICPPSDLMYLVPSPEQFDLITLNDKIKGILEKRNDSGSLPKTEGNELVFIHNTLINILYNDSDKVNNITMKDHINTPNCHLQSAPVANTVLDLYGDVKHVCNGLWSYIDQNNHSYLIGPLRGTTSNQEYDAIIGSCKRAGAKINLSYDESNVWNSRIKSPVSLHSGCIAVDLLNIGYGRITLDKEGICRLELKDKQPVRIMTTGFEDGMLDFLQNHFMVLEVYYGPLHTVIVNKLFNYACVLSNKEIKDVIREKVVLIFWELASHTVKVKDGDVTVPVEDSGISSKYHAQVDGSASGMYTHIMKPNNIVSPVREGNLDINQPDETDVTPVEENGIKKCDGIKVEQNDLLLQDSPKVLVVMDGRASWEFLAATVNIKLFVGDRILNKPMDSLVEERSKTYQEFTVWCLNKLLDKTVRDSVTEIYFDDKAFEEFGQSMKKSATIATEDVQYKDGKFVKVELNSDEAK